MVDKELGSGGPPPSADVVVVGGGLAGRACAWAAARDGAEVVVLDDPAARPPAAAIAAGMIAPVGEASWGEERRLAAALTAADAWPGFADRLGRGSGVEVPYRRCGALHVALDRDEAAELERRHRLHRRLGLDARRLLPSECRRLEPGLSTAVSGGVEAAGEAEVDPRALLAALGEAAREAGAGFHLARARQIDVRSGRVDLESAGSAPGLAEGSIDGGRVVLATGAWAGEGVLGQGAQLPVRPVKGEVLRLRADPDAMPCERIILGERFYLVPRPGGEVVLGASVEERGFDLRVSAGGVHELLREAYRALPELAELEFVEAAAGLRPGTPDNAPIIGPLEGGRVIAVCGLYRHGVLLAPLIVDAAAALLAGRPLPAELGGLGADRFAGAPEVVA